MRNSDDDEKLYEKFTIQGFYALSGWSFMYWLLFGLPMYDGLMKIKWLDLDLSIGSFLKLYLMIWVLLFFPMCLLPKLIDLVKKRR